MILNALKKLDRVLRVFEENALAYGIIAMAVILLFNFLARYIFGIGVGWTEEIGKLCMVVVTYLGLSYVTRLARHINMTVISERLKEKHQRILQIFVNFTTSAFFFYLAASATRYALVGVMPTGRVTTNLRLPIYIMVLMMAVGIFFTALRFLQIAILNVMHKDTVYFSADHPGPVVESESETMQRMQEEEGEKS